MTCQRAPNRHDLGLPMTSGEDARAALDGHALVVTVTHVVGWDIIVSATLVLTVILIYRLATIRARRRSRSSRSR